MKLSKKLIKKIARLYTGTYPDFGSTIYSGLRKHYHIDVLTRSVPPFRFPNCYNHTFINNELYSAYYHMEDIRWVSSGSAKRIQNGQFTQRVQGLRPFSDRIKMSVSTVQEKYQMFLSVNSGTIDFLAQRGYLDARDYDPEKVYQVMHPKFLQLTFLLI